MSKNPWYKRYGADFIAGTLGMSLEEKGAYSIVLDLIYDRDGAIPDDPRYIAGVCGCSVRKWNAIRLKLIELGKIQCQDGFISNFRADKEIENRAKTPRKDAEKHTNRQDKNAENEADINENNDLKNKNWAHSQKLEARSQIDTIPIGMDAPSASKTPRDKLWECVTRLAEQRGENRKALAGVVGRCVKLSGRDHQAVLNVCLAAEAERPLHLEPWLLQHFRARDGPPKLASMDELKDQLLAEAHEKYG